MLRVTEYYANSLKITQCHSKCQELEKTPFSRACVILFHCNYTCISYRFSDTQREIIALSWNIGYRLLEVIENGAIRSLEWIRFSYSQSIVTMAVSCITSEKKRDIGQKSRFFIPLHSTAVGIVWCRFVYGKTRMVARNISRILNWRGVLWKSGV